MPTVSVAILTRDRADLLKKSLESVCRQTYRDFEIIVIDDASTDHTPDVIRACAHARVVAIRHESPKGIIAGRQECLQAAAGEYVAFLDDDDEWLDEHKLQKQVDYFAGHPEAVVVGGSIKIFNDQSSSFIFKKRPQTDWWIRTTMLLRNNFFTSTVMFRKSIALKAGGFIKDGDDLAEDYDLWLRLGRIGRMHNFTDVFAQYRLPRYNKEKFMRFLAKQLKLIHRHQNHYPLYFIGAFILKLRLFISKF